MSTIVPVAVSAAGSLPVHRWIGLGVLLPVELVILTVRFDTVSLTGDGRWWARLLGEAHYLPQLGLTIAVALVLFAGDRICSAFAGIPERLRESHDWIGPITVHLIGFAAFMVLTARLLEGSGAGTATFITCIGAAIVMLAGWSLAVMPFGVWKAVLTRAGWMVALAGGLVGGIGFGVGLASESLWGRMADITLATVRVLLELSFADVTCLPAERILGAGSFAVRIAPSCSGYEGLGLVAAFAGLFLILRREDLRFPHALLLLPLGLAAVWLANVLRIAGLIALGASGWPEIARGGFHSQAGWIGFNAVVLGVIVLARRSRFFSRAVDRGVNPVAAYLAPLVAVVGCAMLTGALSADGFDALYGVRVLVAAAVIAAFRCEYARLGWMVMPWAALGIGAFVFVMWIGIGYGLASHSEETPIPAGLSGLSQPTAVMWLVLRVVGAVLIVPLAEELAFRGFLMRRLQSADFEQVAPTGWSWPAVLASSLLFGLLHPGWWVAGTLAGVCYAVAYWRRGRLADAVIAHAATNALLAVFVLTTGNWYFW